MIYTYGMLSCGSSSHGNSVLLFRLDPGTTRASGILLDAGCSGKRVRGFIAKAERLLNITIQVEAIVVTHLHADHARGLHILANQLSVSRIAIPNVFEHLREAAFLQWEMMSKRAYACFDKLKPSVVPILYAPVEIKEISARGVREVTETVWASRGLALFEECGGANGPALIKHGEVFELSPFGISTRTGLIAVPECSAEVAFQRVTHDTLCYALEVNWGGFRLSYLVDLGSWNSALVEFCRQSDVMVLEMNYDDSLIDSAAVDYPWAVRERIKGQYGHLSNTQAAELLEAILHSNNALQAIFAAHRGGQSNSELLVKQTLARVFARDSQVFSACLARQYGTLVLLSGNNDKTGHFKVEHILTKILLIP